MPMEVVDKQIEKSKLFAIAKERFGDLVKAVVDIQQGIMVVGGELHSDEEAILLEKGSAQKDLWGINLYPDKSHEALIEFDSMINIRPSQGNRSRDVQDPQIREKIKEIVNYLIRET